MTTSTRAFLTLLFLASLIGNTYAINESEYNVCDRLAFRVSLSKSSDHQDLSPQDCISWNENSPPKIITLGKLAFDQSGHLEEVSVFLKKSGQNTTPPFIRYSPKKKTFYFDRNEFLAAINDWPLYQTRIAKIRGLLKQDAITPVASITHSISNQGTLLAYKIVYQAGSKDFLMEKHYSFTTTNGIIVSLDTPLINTQNSVAKNSLAILDKLFASISSTDRQMQSNSPKRIFFAKHRTQQDCQIFNPVPALPSAEINKHPK